LQQRGEENPVAELKETLPKVNLHRGFARVLLGKPKSEGPRPVDEILRDVKSLLKKNKGYR